MLGTEHLQPVHVPSGTTGVVQAAGGDRYTAALRADGSTLGWGSGWRAAPAGTGVLRSIAASWSSTVGVRASGAIVAWGSTSSAVEAGRPGDLFDASQLACGFDHVVALRTNGSVLCWGNNSRGQSSTPADLPPTTQVAAGSRHSIALHADGSVSAWGDNRGGWLNGDTMQSTVPGWIRGATKVAGLESSTVVILARSDCDADGMQDDWSITHGAWDFDRNWVPDDCERIPGDLDMSGTVDLGDMAIIMLDFGPCAGCTSDLDHNGVVDMGDVAMLLMNFGPVG